jgi:hypothetical protein
LPAAFNIWSAFFMRATHRIDVGTSAEQIESDGAAGFDHERLAAGAARDLQHFGNGFGFGRDDEGARAEWAEHIGQHRVVRARRRPRTRRTEDHRVPAQVVDAEDDAFVPVAESEGTRGRRDVHGSRFVRRGARLNSLACA